MNTTLWQDIKRQLIYSSSPAIQIIFINVLVFLMIGILQLVLFLTQASITIDYIGEYLGVSANLKTLLIHPWTLITYGFVHSGILHILFNMLMLYWFGIIYTEYLGNKKFIPLYFLGILSGAALYILVYNIFPVFNLAIENSSMVGASAGVLAIVVATATLLPDYTVMLILIGPVKLKWLALVIVLIDLISIPFGNAGGHVAHIGGALMGFLYIKQIQNGVDIGAWINSFFSFMKNLMGNKKLKVVSYNKNQESSNKKNISSVTSEKNQEKLDIILDKISSAGYDSLSKEEKDFLFTYSKK